MFTPTLRTLQQRMAQSPRLINARDRLFRAETLIQAGRTPFQVIHDDEQHVRPFRLSSSHHHTNQP